MSKTNQSLMERKQKAVAAGVSMLHPIYIASAQNATVVDVEGREYIDFSGGIAVLNTGHRHPKVQAAAAAQMDQLTHTCFMVMGYEPYIELCEKINALAPGKEPKKTALFTSGAEAVENALKVARAHTGRSGVIAFGAAYHGRTLATLALNGKVGPYSTNMHVALPGVYRALYPCALHGVSVADALESIQRIFKFDAEPTDIAAIILEPVQGEGGFYTAPPEFMQALRQLCDEHGIVLVADEVQTGAGRTGTFFATEQLGVVPDITTFAKSIGGGYPLSGIVGKAHIMDSVVVGGLGGTYGGNPVSCAAALAVLEVFEEEQLLDRAKALGNTFKEAFNEMAGDYPCIADVRGLGAMVAVEFFKDGKPDADLPKKLLPKALEKGLILISCGMYGNVLRILVPLTVPDEQVQKGLQIIRECLEEIV